METTKIDQDIHVMFVTASSFPDGVMSAHQKLHSLIPFSEERRYFGLSRPENGQSIVYRAGAEEMKEGEGSALGLEMLVLKKGTYRYLLVKDYMKDLPAIGAAFQKLLEQPGIDPEGYCVEFYLSQTEVRCMVRIEDPADQDLEEESESNAVKSPNDVDLGGPAGDLSAL